VTWPSSEITKLKAELTTAQADAVEPAKLEALRTQVEGITAELRAA